MQSKTNSQYRKVFLPAKLFILSKSILQALRDIKYCSGAKSFFCEIKDTYLWSVSLYQVKTKLREEHAHGTNV